VFEGVDATTGLCVCVWGVDAIVRNMDNKGLADFHGFYFLHTCGTLTIS